MSLIQDPNILRNIAVNTQQSSLKGYTPAPTIKDRFKHVASIMHAKIQVLSYLEAQINIEPYQQDLIAREIFERAMRAALEEIEKP